MKFTQPWFEITAQKNFEKILLPIFLPGSQYLEFLEIGCFEGMATKWLLDNILFGNSSYITVIDTFQGDEKISGSGMKTRFLENMKGYEGKVLIEDGYSQEILRRMDPATKQFDFIYIDGSHKAPDVFQDIALAWPLLKSRGVMAFDDYGNENETVKAAVDAFLDCFKGQYNVLLKDYQVFVEKR